MTKKPPSTPAPSADRASSASTRKAIEDFCQKLYNTACPVIHMHEPSGQIMRRDNALWLHSVLTAICARFALDEEQIKAITLKAATRAFNAHWTVPELGVRHLVAEIPDAMEDLRIIGNNAKAQIIVNEAGQKICIDRTDSNAAKVRAFLDRIYKEICIGYARVDQDHPAIEQIITAGLHTAHTPKWQVSVAAREPEAPEESATQPHTPALTTRGCHPITHPMIKTIRTVGNQPHHTSGKDK